MHIDDPLADSIIRTIGAAGFNVSRRYDLDSHRYRFTAWIATPEGIYRGGEQWHGEGDDDYRAAVALAQAVGIELEE